MLLRWISNDAKDRFYNCLDGEVQRVAQSDKLVVLGDFNARVDSSNAAWPGVLGSNGFGKLNENGHQLLTFCSMNELTITNSNYKTFTRVHGNILILTTGTPSTTFWSSSVIVLMSV